MNSNKNFLVLFGMTMLYNALIPFDSQKVILLSVLLFYFEAAKLYSLIFFELQQIYLVQILFFDCNIYAVIFVLLILTRI